MRTIRSLAFYQHVPTEQRERLRAFRMTHPREQIDLKGATWSYLLGGRGSETLLILPGGERIGDVAFPLMVKALSVRPEERQIFQAMLHELVAHLTRADMVSTFDETIDYRLNYHFSSDDLATWPGKVLIVQSDDDPATTPARRLALRQLYPQAQTHTFERAGHTPFLSQPDEFYPLVRTFLHEP